MEEKDWTKNCNKKPIDTRNFVKRMRDMRDGKEVEWNCPFCEGKVILYTKEGSHTTIGCDTCDMRINLDLD